VVNQLIDEYLNIQTQLLQDEPIELEIDRYPWKGFLEGDRNSWSLKLILSNEREDTRGVEIFWPRSVAQSISIAMRKMWDSN